MKHASRAVASLMLVAGLAYGSEAVCATQAPATLRVSILLVDTDLNMKPVPRPALTLKSETGGAEPIRLVTGLDGKAETAVPSGTYLLESERAVDFQGKSYRWKDTIKIAAGETKALELSVDNALVERIAQVSSVPTDLPSLFKQWQGSVVTVWSDTGHGSGFLIDAGGLIATNQHVVGLSDYAAVQFSDSLKVPATVVVRSPAKDVAILRVNAKYVEGLKPVVLGFAQDGKAPAVEGQQVFTIGSPLNQRKVMTTGIVSKVEPTVIISDVNINHGNSGGPLFTTDGLVVGITTFGDFSSQGGPGISGIVRIDEAREPLEEARQSLATPPPAESTLPVEPTAAFPLEGLKETLKAAPVKPNDYAMGVGDFDVSFITPILTYGTQYAADQAALAEKTKRNKKAGSVQSPSDLFGEYKNWAEYVGQFRAVLIIDARPKLVEGFWSGLNRGLAQSYGYYGGPANLHFKTDFKAMKLLCGEREVTPIHPGKVEHRVSVSNAAVRVNDVTYEGFYTFAADAVAPTCGVVKLVLFSEKEPNKSEVKVLSPKLVQKLWDDFAPYRALPSRQPR